MVEYIFSLNIFLLLNNMAFCLNVRHAIKCSAVIMTGETQWAAMTQ